MLTGNAAVAASTVAATAATSAVAATAATSAAVDVASAAAISAATTAADKIKMCASSLILPGGLPYPSACFQARK